MTRGGPDGGGDVDDGVEAVVMMLGDRVEEASSRSEAGDGYLKVAVA